MASPRKYQPTSGEIGAMTRISGRLASRDAQILVDMARKNTRQAMAVLVWMIEGRKPVTSLKESRPPDADKWVEWDVPPAVRLRAIEILFERAYGKAPQSLVVSDADGEPIGVQAVPILQRVEAMRRALLAQDSTTDLEASELREVPAATTEIVVRPVAPDPYDAL
jgi:hypothetical protein